MVIIMTENRFRKYDELEDDEKEENDVNAISAKSVPAQVEVYEINGPFFFGVADRLKRVMDILKDPPKVFILRMRHVPMVDATGLHALEEFYDLCKAQNTVLVLSGVNPKIKMKMQHVGFDKKIGVLNITDNIDMALIRTNQLLKEGEENALCEHQNH